MQLLSWQVERGVSCLSEVHPSISARGGCQNERRRARPVPPRRTRELYKAHFHRKLPYASEVLVPSRASTVAVASRFLLHQRTLYWKYPRRVKCRYVLSFSNDMESWRFTLRHTYIHITLFSGIVPYWQHKSGQSLCNLLYTYKELYAVSRTRQGRQRET